MLRAFHTYSPKLDLILRMMPEIKIVTDCVISIGNGKRGVAQARQRLPNSAAALCFHVNCEPTVIDLLFYLPFCKSPDNLKYIVGSECLPTWLFIYWLSIKCQAPTNATYLNLHNNPT